MYHAEPKAALRDKNQWTKEFLTRSQARIVDRKAKLLIIGY